MKRSIVALVLCSALALFAFPHPVAAQTTGVTLQANAGDIAAFPQVALAVTVRDANGVPLPDLTAAEFEVLEAAIDAPRPITGVTTRTNPAAQVSVLLVLDISGSMRGQPLADAQAAARQFIAQLGPDDQVALLAFAEAVDLEQPVAGREIDFTRDKAAVLDAIDGLQAGGATPLYDALFRAVRLTNRADLGHRAIVLLSDGVDEDAAGNRPGSAVASPDLPIEEARAANIPVFTIALGSEVDRGYLQRVAVATGGTAQDVPTSAELQATFQNVLERLKQQYVLTYASGYDCDGQTHRVTVGVRSAGRRADDALTIGPLPDAAGCNPSAVPTTAAAPTAAATTAAATDTPPAVPTDVPAAAATDVPTAVPSAAPALPSPTPVAPAGGSTARALLPLCLGVVAVVGLLLLAWAWVRRSGAIR